MKFWQKYPYRYKCEYCGREFIVDAYGKTKGFLIEEDGKLKIDNSCATCYYQHSSLLYAMKKLKKNEKVK